MLDSVTELPTHSTFPNSTTVLTFDVDWAPDWMIDDVAERLIAANVRATWFATHQSAAISRLLDNPAFEVGIHPNFQDGSTQGATPDEILTNLRRWFGTATVVRTHSLFQSERLLQLMTDTYGFKIDCSIYLPLARDVKPHRVRYTSSGSELIRVPHVFQDNMFMIAGQSWSAEPEWLRSPGLKVLNFHPVHVWLNSHSTKAYETLKCSRSLPEWSRSDFNHPSRTQPGVGWFLDHCLSHLRGAQSFTISEIAARWKKTDDTTELRGAS